MVAANDTELAHNSFGFEQFAGQTSYFGGSPPLSQAAGYIVVLGFGLFFTIVTSLIVWVDYHFGKTVETSEHFNTAGRSVKTGLIASVIVSQWTWAATLLQSSNVAYQYGVSGPFWYASGATVQVLLFGIIAVEIKRKAPTAHTVLEIIRARWGLLAHKVFMVFCLMTNMIVTAMLLLGGAAVTNALTGMNIYAASILIPVGVILYTAHGGLKATFISAYLHTLYIMVSLCLFVFLVYVGSSMLGSPSTVFNNLQWMASPDNPYSRPVSGNRDGSYLTMLSKNGLVFGVINIVGNFGTVFVDQSYWQTAIGARPQAAYKGYIAGGLCWFSIPFALATSLGLASVALDLPITPSEAGQGLVPPAVADALMGSSGCLLILIMLFMAVTSTGSQELIAVSTLMSYDVYRTYINPKATGKQIITVSRVVIIIFGLLMGGLAIILKLIDVSLGYVYLLMGVLIGSAVFPIAMCLLWKKCTALAAMLGSVIGLFAGVASWLAYAAIADGEITIDSTGGDYAMLTGNLFAICTSGIVCFVVSWIKPDNYDWKSMGEIALLDDSIESDMGPQSGVDSVESLNHARKVFMIAGCIMTLFLVVVWPCVALAATVFSKGFFWFWVIVSMIWGLLATAYTTLAPLWESRDELWTVTKNLLKCNYHKTGHGGKLPSAGKDAEFDAKPDLKGQEGDTAYAGTEFAKA